MSTLGDANNLLSTNYTWVKISPYAVENVDSDSLGHDGVSWHKFGFPEVYLTMTVAFSTK